jgi:hypothetical protein
MPSFNNQDSMSNQSQERKCCNFFPRHAAFLSLRLTSPLDIVAQTLSCLRAAAKFTPAMTVLFQSPFSDYKFSVDENLQNRLNHFLRCDREPCNVNPFPVWKSSCSVLTNEFSHLMFSPFKLAIRWLKLIHHSSNRTRCNFCLYSGIRSPPHLDPASFEPEIFDALRTDSACVDSITFSCMEIFSLASLTADGRESIYLENACTKLVIDICTQNFEEHTLRVFVLTALHNFSLQLTNQSLELLLRSYSLDFVKDSIGIRNVEVLQIGLQIISNIIQGLALIGQKSLIVSPIFNHFWVFFQDSLCSRVVAAALHPVPAVMASAICIILNSCAPGNPPRIRRLIASSGVFNVLHPILSHPLKNLKLLALSAVASVVDGDTAESLRWSGASSNIIRAGQVFQDKGTSAIDAQIRCMTMTCIHNLSSEPLCWENGLDDMKVQDLFTTARRVFTLEPPT